MLEVKFCLITLVSIYVLIDLYVLIDQFYSISAAGKYAEMYMLDISYLSQLFLKT